MCDMCCEQDLHLIHFKGVEMGKGIVANLYQFLGLKVFGAYVVNCLLVWLRLRAYVVNCLLVWLRLQYMVVHTRGFWYPNA